MNLKSFTAGSMAEALAMVKKHLGPHAVILHTRKYRRGGVLGIGSRQVVEITAADQPPAPRQRPAPKAPAMPTRTIYGKALNRLHEPPVLLAIRPRRPGKAPGFSNNAATPVYPTRRFLSRRFPTTRTES